MRSEDLEQEKPEVNDSGVLPHKPRDFKNCQQPHNKGRREAWNGFYLKDSEQTNHGDSLI